MPRKGADLSSIGAAALSELADGGLGRVVARADGRQPEPCELLPQHREALKRILRGERSAATGSALPPKLCWEDVAVAQRYQALCKLLLRAGPLPAQSPVQLFDGPSFHAFAQSHVPPPHPPPSLTPVQVVINGAAAAAAAAAAAVAAAAVAATPSDAAAYGPMRAAAAAAARFCAQCERRADGAVDPEDGEFYCRRCSLFFFKQLTEKCGNEAWTCPMRGCVVPPPDLTAEDSSGLSSAGFHAHAGGAEEVRAWHIIILPLAALRARRDQCFTAFRRESDATPVRVSVYNVES